MILSQCRRPEVPVHPVPSRSSPPGHAPSTSQALPSSQASTPELFLATSHSSTVILLHISPFFLLCPVLLASSYNPFPLSADLCSEKGQESAIHMLNPKPARLLLWNSLYSMNPFRQNHSNSNNNTNKLAVRDARQM